MRIQGLTVGSCLALLCAAAGPVSAQIQMTTRVSVGTGGAQGSLRSYSPALTPDGRHVVFYSEAPDLVPGDTNGVGDIFLRDRLTRTTTLVSVDSSGIQGDGDSEYPTISADGRYVAFTSHATNLVPGDTNGFADTFVHDLLGGTTTRVSVDSSGAQASGDSVNAVSLSADGRYVAFQSTANNLVPDDHNVGTSDVFVHDRANGTTVRVSVASSKGGHYPSISGDGRFVAFQSASKLAPNDTNNLIDAFVRDLVNATTVLVSVDSDGVQGNSSSTSPVISADGRYVAFESLATNFVPGDINANWDIYVRDLVDGVTTLVSTDSEGVLGNSGSLSPAISGNGRFVVFKSWADNLVPGDTNTDLDVFAHDRVTGITIRASESSAGEQANGFVSSQPTISADGRHVAFYSDASNLVPGDTNGAWDVFVHTFFKVRRR